MREVIELVDRIRVRSAQSHEELARTHGIRLEDPPLGAFGIVHNTAVMTLELLDFYHRTWSSIPPSSVPDPEATRQENAERVMLVTKSAFIMCLSGFEFSAKQALTRYPGRLQLPAGRIYLRAIMRASAKKGLITADTDNLWTGAIAVRNCLVHNNGIADEDAEYKFPDVTVRLESGKMPQGTLKFFPSLTNWTVTAFADWCRAFLR
jgi:predicted nucleic acid-binding protein